MRDDDMKTTRNTQKDRELIAAFLGYPHWDTSERPEYLIDSMLAIWRNYGYLAMMREIEKTKGPAETGPSVANRNRS